MLSPPQKCSERGFVEEPAPIGDRDGDGLPDNVDKCPDEPEDRDGFQDEDGCPDDDNDGDGFPDAADRCPNDPETVNGFEDDDGCPDVRGTTGPEERADRIDLKGAQVTFTRGALTGPSRQLLGQVAALIKNRRLAIRIEVHVASHLAGAALALSLLSCSQVTQMRGDIEGLSKVAEQAERNGAMRCAPTIRWRAISHAPRSRPTPTGRSR